MTAPSVETLLSRIDLGLLYPPFLLRVRAMLAELAAHDGVFWATCGWRGPAEQNRLYAQGRTTPGDIVTRATAFQSPHQFGIAVDLVRDVDNAPGVQPGWAPALYAPLGPASTVYRLTWGGTWEWPDRPHVQWPGYVSGEDLASLRGAWALGAKNGGGTVAALSSVWRHLDQFQTPKEHTT